MMYKSNFKEALKNHINQGIDIALHEIITTESKHCTKKRLMGYGNFLGIKSVIFGLFPRLAID